MDSQTVPPRRLSRMKPTIAEKTSEKPGRAVQSPKTSASATRAKPIPAMKGQMLLPGKEPITEAPAAMVASERSSGRGAMRLDHQR